MSPRTTSSDLMLEEFLDWSHAKLGMDSMVLLSHYETAKAELNVPSSAYHGVARTVIEWYEQVIGRSTEVITEEKQDDNTTD